MFSYISFQNKSSSPALIIFLDGAELEELLLMHEKSRLHITEAGSHAVIVADRFFNTMFDLYIPLFPHTFNTLIIEDNAVYLTGHLP